MRLIKALLFVFLCLCSFTVWAQTKTIPIVYDVEDIKSVRLDKHVFIYEDATQKLPFEKIVVPSMRNKFTPYTQAKLPLKAGTTYWARVVLNNRLSWDSDWFLNIGGADFIDVYISDNQGKFSMKKTGSMRPDSELADAPFKRLGVNISLYTGKQTVVFIKLYNKQNIAPSLDVVLAVPITAHKQAYQRKVNRNLWQGIFQGIIWIMLLYHLLIFIPTRDKAYLYYTLYLLVIAIANLAETGFLTESILGEYPSMAIYLEVLFSPTVEIFYFLFTRHFLDTAKKVPKVDRLLTIWIVVRLVVLLLIFIVFLLNAPRDIAGNIVYYINAVEDVLVVVILVLLYRNYEKSMVLYLFVLGTFILALSTFTPFIFNSLHKVGVVIPLGINWYIFSQSGVVIELLFFSLALGQRIRVIEEEKRKAEEKNARLLKEQTIVLEKKVKERTAEIEQQKEEILAQRDNLAELNTNINRKNKEIELANFELSEKNEIIEAERQKSEELLLNILPEATALELKEKGSATPEHYDMVSVLFTDFKGFTKLAENLSPNEVIEQLNYCFTAFDEICERFGLEKIKTIGDAYMAAGGIPIVNETNPLDAVKAGLEMQRFMKAWRDQRLADGLLAWELRLGIHTGELVAGVIGKHKFAYDIWGDTVNLASRMESSGEVGRVNISGATYALVAQYVETEYRGKIQAKNKGEVDMYFVNKLKNR